MKIDTAQQAGVIAERILQREAKIAEIKLALEQGYCVSNLRAVGRDGNDISLILDTLDLATSKVALTFTLQIYQAQLDALNTELAGL